MMVTRCRKTVVGARLVGIVLLALLFALPWARRAWAAPLPQGPSFQANINKSFLPIAIPAGGTATLTVTIYNPNSFPLTLSSAPNAWTDSLPAGMTFAEPANITSTCGGTVTTTGATLALVGGSVPAQVGEVPGSCAVSVVVTSTTAGNLINTIPAGALRATDPGGANAITNPTPASATLQVNAVQPPSLSKAFVPNTIWVAQNSVLTITIRNNDANTSLTGLSLTDTLPNGLIIADTPNVSNACNGAISLSTNSIRLTGGSVPRSATCTVSVSVTSVTPGIYSNLIPAGAIQTQQGVTNGSAAPAPLNVQSIGLVKSFSPANFQSGGVTTLTITLQNPTSTPYTGAAFTDTLPTGLTLADPANATTTCANGALTTTANSVRLSGATIPGGTPAAPGSCRVTVQVTGDTPATYTNRIPAGGLTTEQGASNVLPATANVGVYLPGAGLTGSKSFTASTIAVNGASQLTINITAPADTALSGVVITDTLPTGLRVASPTGASRGASCVGGSFAPAAGDTSLRYNGGAIPAGATCTLRVNVTGGAPGVYTNTISAANISNAENRNLASNLSANLTISGVQVAKAFAPTSVNPEGISTLTLTLTNNNLDQMTDVTLTDNLPGSLTQGVVIAANPRASTTCGDGVVGVAAGGKVITLSGGVIPAQVGSVPGICTILVDVVGRGTSATHTNTIPIGGVSGLLPGVATRISNPTAASATLTVQPIRIAVVKGFNPLTVFAGSASTLTITLSNPTSVALTGIAFADNLPQRGPEGGMSVANPPNPSTGACGGMLNAAPGATSFSFSGGSLLANASCTLTLRVTMNVENNLTNTIPAGAVTTTNGAANDQAASASLTNLPGASVSKAFSANPIPAGAFSTLSITIQNVSNFPITGVGLTDTLPAGLEVAAPPATPQCGGAISNTAGSLTLTGGSLPAYAACTIQVEVRAPAAGSFINCIRTGALTTDQGATNQVDACDTLAAITPPAPPAIRKAFSPASIAAGRTSALTFTLTNPPANSAPLTGVSFTDTFPSGMVLASLPNAAQCGGVVRRLAADSISLTGGVIPVNGSCTVTVSVTAAAGGSYANTSGPVTSTNGGEGGVASATLQVVAPPAIDKSFSPDSIAAGGRSTLIFQISNPNPATVLIGAAFTDALPSGMRVADPPNVELAGCSASSTPVFAPLVGAVTLAFSNGSIAGGGTCQVSVDVTADGGTHVNTTSVVTSTNGGSGGSDSATLTALGAGLSLSKTTTAASFRQVGESLPYLYRLTNTGDAVLYPPFQVNDSRIGLISDCGGAASLSPGESTACTTNDTVLPGDITARQITNRATASAQDAETGGATVTSNESSVTVRLAALSIIKRTPTTGFRGAGDVITYTYTLTNTGEVTLYGSGPGGVFTLTDNRLGTPAGTPVVCQAGALSLTPGANLVCTGVYTYAVTAADVTAGLVTNTAFSTAFDQSGGGAAVTSNTASLTVYLVRPPAISKSFSPASIPVGGAATLTLTLINPSANVVPLTGVAFNDIFPVGLAVTQPPDAAQCGGTVSYNAGTRTLAFSGGTVLPNSSCAITATVTAASAGSYPNTTQAVTSINGGSGLASNTATLLVAAPALIQKSFAPVTILAGQRSRLTLTLTNPNPTAGLTGVAFNDPFPAGMRVADPPNAQTTGCGAPTFAPLAGDARLDFSGGSIAAAGVCTVQVDVQAAAGVWSNVAGAVSSNEGGTGAPSNPAVLTVDAPALSLDKRITGGATFAAVGDILSYEYVLTNTGNVTLIGAGAGGVFTVGDDRIAAVTCPATPTGLAPGASLTCTGSDTVTQTDLDAGSVTNTAVAHGRYGGTPVDSNADTAAAEALQDPALTLEKLLTAGDPFSEVGAALAYRYTLTNSGNVTLQGTPPDGFFTVSDDRIGDPPGTAFACGAATELSPGASLTCTAEYRVTQADLDAGGVTNTAAGAGRFGESEVPSNPDSATADAGQESGLLLQKSIIDGDPFTRPGDPITYHYTLTNTGNVTLTGDGSDGSFTVTDDHIGDSPGAPFACGSAVELAPGHSLTCQAEYLVTVEDRENESVTNRARGHALFGSVAVVSNEDSAMAGVELGMILGVVYHDANLNGKRDDGETPLAGVTVSLYDESGALLIATAVTGADGGYSFLNLLPRPYQVVETDPNGYVSTSDNNVPVTVPPGESAHADFGDTLVEGSSTNSIHGVVYNDANNNGVQDAGEAVIAGVTVTLYDSEGEVVATAVTGADGGYRFTALPPGVYTVVETNLEGYLSTTLDAVAVTLTAHTDAEVNFGDRAGVVEVVDPAVTKYGSPSTAKVGDTVIYTLSVGNNGDLPAADVVVTDTLPVFLDLIHADVAPDRGLPLVMTGRTLTLTIGTLLPGESYTITLLTRVNALGKPPGGSNVVTLMTSSDPQPVFNDSAAVRLVILRPAEEGDLPDTGFAPGRVTRLPFRPDPALAMQSEMRLSIPAIGVDAAVVGVPAGDGEWDVSWLGSRLGYLQGTAYPTWPGNSVLTGHVYGADGRAGPLVNLGALKWGDRILIHANGQTSTYAVREVRVTGPVDASVFRHEDQPWLTLVTCQGYDPRSHSYLHRVVARAVLVKVE